MMNMTAHAWIGPCWYRMQMHAGGHEVVPIIVEHLLPQPYDMVVLTQARRNLC